MSEYVPWLDVWITQATLPMRVKAFCKQLPTGDCIILNKDLADDKKLEAVVHEMRHLVRGDLDDGTPVAEIERRTKFQAR